MFNSISSSENPLTKYLWCEKYRPKCIDECILPVKLKKTFKSIEASKNIPNMLLAGSHGLGKTTVARALCESLGLTYMIVNASEDNGIDILRGRIREFASTMSMNGMLKVVILDEADHLNANSTQPALRGFIEEFSESCRFILTANFKNRIIEPLHSRCTVIDFNVSAGGSELPSLCEKFFARLIQILKDEGAKFSPKPVADLIIKYAPDWRRVLNESQRIVNTHGEFNEETIHSLSDTDIQSLVDYVKTKNFRDARKWVSENTNLDSTVVLRSLYDDLLPKLSANSVPQVVVIIADYLYKSAFVADKEINTIACITEIMAAAEFEK